MSCSQTAESSIGFAVSSLNVSSNSATGTQEPLFDDESDGETSLLMVSRAYRVGLSEDASKG